MWPFSKSKKHPQVLSKDILPKEIRFGDNIWYPIRIIDKMALLYSKHPAGWRDLRFHNEENCLTTWRECSLRRWLNSDYLREGFSSAEREAIITTKVATSHDGILFSYDSDLNDSVFIPTVTDVVTYAANQCSLFSLADGTWRENLNNFLYVPDERKCYGYFLRRAKDEPSLYVSEVIGDVYDEPSNPSKRLIACVEQDDSLLVYQEDVLHASRHIDADMIKFFGSRASSFSHVRACIYVDLDYLLSHTDV